VQKAALNCQVSEEPIDSPVNGREMERSCRAKKRGAAAGNSQRRSGSKTTATTHSPTDGAPP